MTINIHKLVSKEIFSLKKNGVETLWMVSGFDDELDINLTWHNVYDYIYLQNTGEYLPYFTEGEGVKTIQYFGNTVTALEMEDFHKRMEAEGFVWKY